MAGDSGKSSQNMPEIFDLLTLRAKVARPRHRRGTETGGLEVSSIYAAQRQLVANQKVARDCSSAKSAAQGSVRGVSVCWRRKDAQLV